MVRKSRADDPITVVSVSPPTPYASKPSRGAQAAETSEFGLERRAGWRLARHTPRPINLERRAHFARIEAI